MKKRPRELNLFSMSALDLFASAMGVFIILTIVVFSQKQPPPVKEEVPDDQKKVEQLTGQLLEIKKELLQCNKNSQAIRARLKKCEKEKSELDGKLVDYKKSASSEGKIRQCSEKLVQCTSEKQELTERLARIKEQTINIDRTREIEQELESCKKEVENCNEQLSMTFLSVLIQWNTERQDVDLYVRNAIGNEFSWKYHNRKGIHFSNTKAELSVDAKSGPALEIWQNPRAKPGTYHIYVSLWDRVGNPANPKITGYVYYRDGVKRLPDVILTREDPEGKPGLRKKRIATIKVTNGGQVSIR